MGWFGLSLGDKLIGKEADKSKYWGGNMNPNEMYILGNCFACFGTQKEVKIDAMGVSFATGIPSINWRQDNEPCEQCGNKGLVWYSEGIKLAHPNSNMYSRHTINFTDRNYGLCELLFNPLAKDCFKTLAWYAYSDSRLMYTLSWDKFPR